MKEKVASVELGLSNNQKKREKGKMIRRQGKHDRIELPKHQLRQIEEWTRQTP